MRNGTSRFATFATVRISTWFITAPDGLARKYSSAIFHNGPALTLFQPNLFAAVHPAHYETSTRLAAVIYPNICVSPQIEIACPEIVLPRGLHMNRI